MRAGRVDIGAIYRVGRSGALITWRDGSITSYAAGATLTLPTQPKRIEGRLFRVTRLGHLGYEAPTLRATR